MNFGRVLHTLSGSDRVELERWEDDQTTLEMPEMCTAMLVPRVIEVEE
ncbi:MULTISPECIES: hypothetical protein [unclassified Methanopyrus]|nr:MULTISPECIES: hypothetical protein [unclassified Methanopyrus]